MVAREIDPVLVVIILFHFLFGRFRHDVQLPLPEF